MRCPQCQFENIPGQDRCLRCNAVLQATGLAIEINPPRMATWKRPFREMSRWFRLHRMMPQSYPKWVKFFKIMSGNAFIGLILSLIPGFAHLVGGRFREIIWFFIIWLLAFCAGVYIYGSNFGMVLIGIAVGVHALIAFQHTLLKEHEEILQQLIDFVLLLVLVGLFYFGVRRVALGDFVFGYTNLTIPDKNVQFGDLLLGRRSTTKPAQLHRGDLALVPQRRVGGNDYLTLPSFVQGQMVGQIIGLPRETVEISDGNFIINNEVLPRDKYPVPLWLRRIKPAAIVVPEDSYFVSTEYNVYGHGVAELTEQYIAPICRIKASAIEAKAIMLWFPLDRRGYLKEDQ
jgi:hypothetical protein